MTPAHNKVFNAAIKDNKFLLEFCSINGNEPPDCCSDGIDKAIFGGCYLGWLVGSYGTKLGSEVYSNIIKE